MREEKKHVGGKWETINFIGVALIDCIFMLCMGSVVDAIQTM